MTNPIQQAEKEYSENESDVYSLEEFLEYAKDNPNAVANSIQYLVNAIEHFGTRTVIEYGEELERYRFFDDPANDGEHAVYGNTEVLNSFVESLKRKADDGGENDKIIWFVGPTATGKSEFKRCLVNGLQAYSQTEEGKRFTIEWSTDSLSSSKMTYGDAYDTDKDWHRSPVNVNPIAVLPEKTRRNFLEEVGVNIDVELDPFSREFVEVMSEKYDNFSDIVSEEHLRVVSYTPEIGDGIGLIQSDDTGQTKDLLVGSWMQGAIQDLHKRGQKNAQAFTYDGLVSQGNSLVSIVEDVQNQGMFISNLMNVCEDNIVKLDNKITMHVDTLFICISNPDFNAALNEYSDAEEFDPQKAIRRRMEKHPFSYLTSLTLETQLLLKHLLNEPVFWGDEDVEEQREKVSQPIEKYGSHFSPHALETAAYFNVASRVEDTTISRKNKIEYYDKGYKLNNGKKLEYKQENLKPSQDGRTGIPVTYTERVLQELAQEKDCILPFDVVDKIVEESKEEPIFSDSEVQTISEVSNLTNDYSYSVVEGDVLEAMIGDSKVAESEIQSYVDSLFAWNEEDEENYDNYELREFEKKYFNASEGEYRENAVGGSLIQSFRKDEILQPLNKFIYDNSREYEGEEIPIKESPTFRTILEDKSWERVNQLYENLDLTMWNNPSSGSETEEVKQQTIENMVEMGYTKESAEKASSMIIKTDVMELVE